MPVVSADLLSKGRFLPLESLPDEAKPETPTLGECRSALLAPGKGRHMVSDGPSSDTGPGGLRVSVITCAFNEAQNIHGFLYSILHSRQTSFTLQEVICVVSGSTDGTEEIVRSWSQRDPRVRLIAQSDRIGKAAALSIGLSAARGEILVVENADTLPLPESIDLLVTRFQNPEVSLACSHPTPLGEEHPGWIRAIGATLWELHDVVSRRVPKAGEAFAFRAPAILIPWDVEDDDTYVGICIGRRGGESVYVPEAIIVNRTPGSAIEYFRQRFRVNSNIVRLWRQHNIRSSTWRARHLLPALITYVKNRPERLLPLFGLALSESLIRAAAFVGSWTRRSPRETWPPIPSTKRAILLIGPACDPE